MTVINHCNHDLTCAARCADLDGVAHVAVADEGALGVLTLPEHAQVGIQLTLVHICRRKTRAHSHTCEKKRLTDGCIPQCTSAGARCD